jgi:hypothetical protein
MIEKFVRGEDVLYLRNRRGQETEKNNTGEHEPNIYDIDSISLLIGDNGAGKTHVLDSIWDGLESDTRTPRPLEWEPVFSGDAVDGRDKVGVIYLSHAPNHAKKKTPKGHWCIDASPSVRPDSPPEFLFDDADELLGTLTGQTARFAATWRINPRLVLRHCMGLLLNSRIEMPKIWMGLDQEFADVRHAYDKITQPSDTPKSMKVDITRLQPVYRDHPDFDLPAAHFLDEMYNVLHGIHSPRWEALFFFRLETLIRAGADSKVLAAFFTRWSEGEPALDELNELDGREGVEARALLAMLDGENGPITVKSHRREISATVVLDDRYAVQRMRASPLRRNLKIGWMNVSSGLWALATQCEQLSKAIAALSRKRDLRSILVLIDEGDAFLHVEWQRKYIQTINRFLASCKEKHHIGCLQVIIATHSPLLATDVPSHYVNRIHERQMVEPKPSFAAPLQTLLNTSFGARTMGAHALACIRNTIDNIRKGEITATDRYVMRIVDDTVIRRELERLVAVHAERNNNAVD